LSAPSVFLKSYGYILIPKGNSIYVNKIYLKNEKPKDFTFSEVMFPEIIPKSLDAKIIKLSSYDKRCELLSFFSIFGIQNNLKT
jgi:hypothetical protein